MENIIIISSSTSLFLSVHRIPLILPSILPGKRCFLLSFLRLVIDHEKKRTRGRKYFPLFFFLFSFLFLFSRVCQITQIKSSIKMNQYSSASLYFIVFPVRISRVFCRVDYNQSIGEAETSIQGMN